MRWLSAVAFVAALVLGVNTAGCGGAQGEDHEAALGEVSEGAACGALAVCAAPLVCVDGRCRPRGWAWAPDAPADSAGATDVIPDSATVTDTVTDTVADTATVTDTVAGTDTDTVADAVADAVADTLADVGTVADTATDTDTDMLADTGTDTDTDMLADTAAFTDALLDTPPATTTLLLSEDSADLAVGQDSVALALGQGWVTTLHVPEGATIVGAQALARDSFDGESCGLFSLAVWAPNGGDAGPGAEPGAGATPAWPDQPTWVSSTALPLQGLQPAQLLLLPAEDRVPIPAGLLRVGLVYAAPCEGEPPPPLLLTDTSGQLGVGFLYDPGAGGVSPWIPDAFLGLQGRWALRLLVTVPVL